MATKRRTRALGARTRPRRRKPLKRAARTGSRLEFNHAMIYSSRLAQALEFYRDRLGFEVVDEYRGAYARLQSPGGRTTIALHGLEPGQNVDAAHEGVRLYFEIKGLDALCERLVGQGVRLDKMPQDMPWGWRHAYLRDPDGHELSLYWAGRKRFQPTRFTR
jgi:catechol 2,3-dioxygenase-like lactoylglutathione lyase family enzyme